MTTLSEMPVVTVEQIMRFRQAAMAVEQQNASLLQEFNNVCNQRDQLEQQNAELLALIDKHIENIIAVDKTPRYEYGKSKKYMNNKGEYAGAGSRWLKPSELAVVLRHDIAKYKAGVK